jgi:hypothetical protein
MNLIDNLLTGLGDEVLRTEDLMLVHLTIKGAKRCSDLSLDPRTKGRDALVKKLRRIGVFVHDAGNELYVSLHPDSIKHAIDVLEHKKMQNNWTFGEIFDYPTCCIERFDNENTSYGRYLIELIEVSESPQHLEKYKKYLIPHSLVSHIPCSPFCEEARLRGEMYANVLAEGAFDVDGYIKQNSPSKKLERRLDFQKLGIQDEISRKLCAEGITLDRLAKAVEKFRMIEDELFNR